MTLQTTIDDFFNHYASHMNSALFGDPINIDEITSSFADYFVGAGPLGVMGGKNDEAFRSAIGKGIEFYRSIGINSMNIISKEIDMLDDIHALAKIHWNSLYSKNELSGEISFVVIYLLQCKKSFVKIFSYITGDERKAFAEHGLIQ